MAGGGRREEIGEAGGQGRAVGREGKWRLAGVGLYYLKAQSTVY